MGYFSQAYQGRGTRHGKKYTPVNHRTLEISGGKIWALRPPSRHFYCICWVVFSFCGRGVHWLLVWDCCRYNHDERVRYPHQWERYTSRVWRVQLGRTHREYIVKHLYSFLIILLLIYKKKYVNVI